MQPLQAVRQHEMDQAKSSPCRVDLLNSFPFSCLRHWDTLAGFSRDFVWDFILQLLFFTKTNTILANKGLKSY